MKNESRMTNSIRNSFFVTISQFINIILGFVLQTIFVHTLGGTYLGIKGLFTNILSVLSFSELGIGSAITFSLYKPLAENDQEKIASIMAFFKKAYEIIGIFIGIVGLSLIPFLHYFTHVHINNLYWYYVLFLANTVISYFFTYKRTLLNADQKNYLNTVNQLIFKLIQVISQIIILLVYKNFILFLIIQLMCTFLSNLLISIKVNKQYPYINKIAGKLTKETQHEIFTNTFGSIGEKIGTIIVQSTDNMLISYFINLFVSGVYSNYLLVTSSLTSFIGQASSAVSSSIGNLAVEKRDNKEHQYDTLKKFFFIDQCIIFVVSVCLLTLFNPFIKLWVGAKFQFPMITVILLVINFIITSLRSPITSFVTAYGLYAKDGVKAVIEAIFNLVLSIVYVKCFKLGVNGIILGTITSNIICNWYEPYVVIKYGMRIEGKFKEFILLFVKYLVIDTVLMIIVNIAINKFFVVHNFIQLVLQGIVTLTVAIILLLIFWGKNQYFTFIVELLKRILKSI